FVPTETTSCSCGEPRQTRELCNCLLFTHQSIHLRVSLHLISSEIMGTEKGIVAMVTFLEESDAFKK
ncbi:uncharacterized protein F5147DRAFT_524590, partial [Suillus discolor]